MDFDHDKDDTGLCVTAGVVSLVGLAVFVIVIALLAKYFPA